MIEILALEGIGEVTADTDLAAVIAAAAGTGGLADGDIVVVTSKIISKAEGRTVPADDRGDVVARESAGVVARRGGVRILRTRHGLTMAAAGVDNSNVAPGTVLTLPLDPDASADRLRAGLRERFGRRVGVIVSDTSGRAWRIGQTDLAIGASGVASVDRYAGRRDAYGNELAVTAMVLADELAAAADLAKRKLAGRPVAVVRGLSELVVEDGEPARALVRAPQEDLFGHGTREAVLVAVCAAIGAPQSYDRLVELDGDVLYAAVLEVAAQAGGALDETTAAFVARLLSAAAYPGT